MKRTLGTREWQYCCDVETRNQIKIHHKEGMSYLELARVYNISKSTVSRYCRGVSQAKKSNFEGQDLWD